MKHEIAHGIWLWTLTSMVMLTMTLSSCSNNGDDYAYNSPREALNACHREVSKLLHVKEADMDKVADIINRWLEMQDSTLTCFIQDSTAKADVELAAEFYAVSDSFRTEITRLAMTGRRALSDVVRLKVKTAAGREQTIASDDFKMASDFYSKMDKEPLYQDVEQATEEYEKLLTTAHSFKKEEELHDFIRKEDKCFRSLLIFLKDVPQEKLQDITDKTAGLFGHLYANANAYLDNAASERVMLFLTMRFNRRIMQNAETCREDIISKVELTEQQTGNYRWMIIQPFMAIDNYAMAVLTDRQVAILEEMAEELPRLLTYVDGKDYDSVTIEETEKLSVVLSEYFLKSYLKSIL